MRKYKKKIEFRTFILAVYRHFYIFIGVFLSIALMTIVFTQCVLDKTYESSVYLNSNSGIASNEYHFIFKSVKNDGVAYKICNDLSPVKHFDGSSITTREILDGIELPTIISGVQKRIIITFSSWDSSITKTILQKVVEISIPTIKSYFPDISVSDVTESKDTGNNTKWMLFGLAGAVILSYIICFAFEIGLDRIYDEKDVEKLGCDCFVIDAQK